MQYDPIKRSLGRFFTGSLFLRKSFYCLLNTLLLRTWHVNNALRKLSQHYPDDASILDAGAGFGQYTWRMSKMNKKWRIKGVDINKEHVEECKKFFNSAGLSDRVTFEILDLTELSDQNSYDLVLSVDVMEHIKDDSVVFNNFYKSLKESGFLLISTPSDRGGSDVHSDSETSFINEHVRNGYSIEDIEGKLADAGFGNIRSVYTYGKPGNISWRLSIKYPIKMLNTSGIFLMILPLYYLITFPFSLILNIFDLCLTHNTGTGLLVIAQK